MNLSAQFGFTSILFQLKASIMTIKWTSMIIQLPQKKEFQKIYQEVPSADAK